MTYIVLFLIAFLSATLLPMGSEALLLYDITQNHSLYLLWLFATAGNTLGSMFNYWIGQKGEHYLEKKKYLSEEKMDRYRSLFGRYGGASLLMSWVPIIGDPLTLVAGVLGYSFRYFMVIVAFAKGLRYAVVIYLAVGLSA